ncbi:hypothetical protein [Paenibacillus arenilitoris]|uniref:TfoX N-terminal domain-containing protein n=1 Tax=Paenibacillus arenilitoris TaxID=2772299 RepID=A0A927CT29_9BACL|nr:hypothetical protein [Paenibacillus arenilitoris]MBD2872408.1 hypothetical protein [Paenibacillus arenilitoris]
MSGSSHYEEIVRILCEDPEVRATVEGGMKRFGASGELRIGGKMFAFSAKERLIVKLPESKVAALIADGRGEPCVMGRGRTMREWVVIGPERKAEWLSITKESKAFVLKQLLN